MATASPSDSRILQDPSYCPVCGAKGWCDDYCDYTYYPELLHHHKCRKCEGIGFKCQCFCPECDENRKLCECSCRACGKSKYSCMCPCTNPECENRYKENNRFLSCPCPISFRPMPVRDIRPMPVRDNTEDLHQDEDFPDGPCPMS